MSKTGVKALKELRRRLDRAYDKGTTDIVLRADLVRALVTDAGALDDLENMMVVVQPYHRFGNNSPAMEAWEVGYPDDKILGHGNDERSVQKGVDILLLRAIKRVVTPEVRRLKDKGVRILPTDPPEQD